jgi:hypothetical protein
MGGFKYSSAFLFMAGSTTSFYGGTSPWLNIVKDIFLEDIGPFAFLASFRFSRVALTVSPC